MTAYFLFWPQQSGKGYKAVADSLLTNQGTGKSDIGGVRTGVWEGSDHEADLLWGIGSFRKEIDKSVLVETGEGDGKVEN